MHRHNSDKCNKSQNELSLLYRNKPYKLILKCKKCVRRKSSYLRVQAQTYLEISIYNYVYQRIYLM